MRTLTPIVTALAAGIIFGVGLAVAQMIDPNKVKNFLDIAAIADGGWDPSLAFVMGGGAIVAFFGLRVDRIMRNPIVGPEFHTNTRTRIDRRLLVGSALFGIGWGVSGFCPGPAIANLGIIPQSVVIFVVAMLAGSWLTGAILGRSDRSFSGSAHVVAK